MSSEEAMTSKETMPSAFSKETMPSAFSKEAMPDGTLAKFPKSMFASFSVSHCQET